MESHMYFLIKWFRYCSIKGPVSTLRVVTMATLYTQRHFKVIIKWCCSIKGPMSTLKVDFMATLCRQRYLEVMIQ